MYTSVRVWVSVRERRRKCINTVCRNTTSLYFVRDRTRERRYGVAIAARLFDWRTWHVVRTRAYSYSDSPGRERTRRVGPPSDERRVGPQKTSTWSMVSWWQRRQEGGVRSARTLSPRTLLLIVARVVTAVVDTFLFLFFFFFLLLLSRFRRARVWRSTAMVTRLAPHHRTTERVREAHGGKQQEATGWPRTTRLANVARESRQLIGRREYHRRLSTITRNRVQEINETRTEEDTRLEVPERSRACARFTEDRGVPQNRVAVRYSRYGSDGLGLTIDNLFPRWLLSR